MKMLVEFQRRPRLAGRLSPQKAEGITSTCRGTNSSHVAVAGAAAAGRPVTWYTIKHTTDAELCPKGQALESL